MIKYSNLKSYSLTHFGCSKCRKAPEAGADFEKLPFEKLKVLYGTSHHSFWYSKCKYCHQPYLEEFRDEIDWLEGNDSIWSYWMPLRAKECGVLNQDNIGLGDIKTIMRKRTFLINEYKEEGTFFWEK
jgi:hypothetical protein